MIRLIFILIIITALSLGIAWIADEPGRVAIDWGNYHIETSLLVVLAGTAVTALACIVVYYLFFAIFRTPRSWLRSRLARRQSLGLEALTSAFAAIATQDIRSARKQIGRAQQYLPHQPLTLMLASQLARLEGNESQSRLYLEQMLKAESTEFMALRGLIETSRRAHDDDTALAHAEKAMSLKSSDPWLVTVLVGLYAKKRRTQDALRLLDLALRKRTITKTEHRTLTAGVYYEHAKQLLEQGRSDLTITALVDALYHQPGLAPASALLAKTHIAGGEVPAALKAIVSGWKVNPHPLLTDALAECYGPEKTRVKIVRTAEKLAQMHPENRESRFLMATIALKTGHADSAKNELQYLIDAQETVRACTLMAQAENAAGDSAASTEWLKRSHLASSDPDYDCNHCHQMVDEWQLSCPHCGAVGTLEWK